MIKEKDIVNLLNSYLAENNNTFANEIRMGSGTPDIMLALSMDCKSTFLDDYYSLKTFDCISKNNIECKQDLFESVDLPKQKLQKILELLVDSELISIEDEKINLINSSFLEDEGINISIEVKVKDWRSGLLQAQRYLNFSDYSYLAIYKKYLKNVNIEEAKNLGIGILTVDETEINEVLPPRRSSKCNGFFKHISLSHMTRKSYLDIKSNDTFFDIKNHVCSVLAQACD